MSVQSTPGTRRHGVRSAAVALFCLPLVAILAWAAASLYTPVGQASARTLSDATPTLPPGTGAIAGLGWQDLNANGVREDGEPPEAGIALTLTDPAGKIVATATTDANGAYRLNALLPATYRLTAAPPAGSRITTESSYRLAVSAGAVLSIDFGVFFPPTATPTATPVPALDVDHATFAYCGSTVQGDTRAAANNVSRYGCKPAWDESGPELVYRIDLARGQVLSASFLTTTVDLDLFLLSSAYPDSCLAGGDSYLSMNVQPGFYFLAVDGYQGAAGQFSLRITCPYGPQATATPTSPPSPTPTVTKTPAPSPTLTPTATTRPISVFLPLISHLLITPTPEPAFLTFQDGLQGYTGTTDTYLSVWVPSAAYGSSNVLYLRLHRQDPMPTHMAPLVRFDLSLLPSEAQVVSATLKLYLVEPPGGYNILASVHGMLRDWDEAAATWETPGFGQTWAAPGAQAAGQDYLAVKADAHYIELANQWYTFDVTDLVRMWVRDPAANHGVILLAAPGTDPSNQAGAFASREQTNAALRPQLTVGYWVGD